MNTNSSMLIISGIFYLYLLSLTFLITYGAIKLFIKRKRRKRAYYFFTEGYEVISTDKDGIPTFMKKGGNIEQI